MQSHKYHSWCEVLVRVKLCIVQYGSDKQLARLPPIEAHMYIYKVHVLLKLLLLQ